MNKNAKSFDGASLFNSKTGMDKLRKENVKDDKKIISESLDILQRYKNGRTALENRIIAGELFWQRSYTEHTADADSQGNIKNTNIPKPTSAWLFSAVINKHADLMDNYPEAVCLPRESSDEASAKTLTEIIPVILERAGFEKTYSDNAWYKLKHGTCAYGVFWDSRADNGLGEIAVRPVDLLNLYWEPGITELEASHNVFCVSLMDKEDIIAAFPDSGFKDGGKDITVAEYIRRDYVDTSDKCLVVDRYYKKLNKDGKTVLHMLKFAGGAILYSSEDDPECAERGLYDHGRYPFILDVLYPESGTPCGFGIIDVTKNPQMFIDKLDASILQHSLMAGNPRFFMKKNVGINKAQFLDWNEPIVEVEGDLTEERVRPISLSSLPAYVINVRNEKINEMKETSGNRDVNSGGTTGGVTSGAAIATLQEAGSKGSRDITSSSYRAFRGVVDLIIELMRQFYDENRCFRVVSPNSAKPKYIDFSNSQLKGAEREFGGEILSRVPIFDVDVKAQKRSPFSRLSQNETVMNLFKLGFFAPENAQQASIALEALEFDGKEQILEKVKEGATLLNTCNQLKARLEQITAAANTEGVPGSAPVRNDEDVRAGSAADRNALAARGYSDTLSKRALSDNSRGVRAGGEI